MGLRGYVPIAILAAVLLVIMLISLIFSQADLVIGGKNYTEQVLLVHILSDLIEDQTNLKVRQRPFLGGTLVTFQALRQGGLDGYVEYTGTALTVLLEKDPLSKPKDIYTLVAEEFETRWDLVWLSPLGFNNTYVMTMRQEDVEELGISSVSELKLLAGELILGATHEFLERADGYAGFKKHYDLEFRQTRALDPGLTYQAAGLGEVDIIDGFATDGRIRTFNLRPLKDDKNYFPPYHAAPLFRRDVLNSYPELEEVIELLANRLDDETMRSLNYEVDSKHRDPLIVAREWLIEEGLVRKN